MAALFLYSSPGKSSRTATKAINYFTGYFLLWGFAISCYLAQIWLNKGVALFLSNICYLTAAYSLKSGFYWRMGNKVNLAQNPKIIAHILLYGAIQGMTVFIPNYEILFRIFFYAVNVIAVLATCIYLVPLKRRDKQLFGETTAIIALKLMIIIQVGTAIASLIIPQSYLVYFSYNITILSLILLLAAILTLLLSDVTEQHYLNSIKDGMTNLYNRRYFLEQANITLKSASRHQFPISLIICDIDKFKNINDSYGHAIGDEVLITTANSLNNHCRESDILARIGGEEFVVLLPQTDIKGAETLAERMRETIAHLSMRHNQEDIFITASFGIAYCNYSVDIETTLQAADKALYQAKNNGRNQVCTHQAIN